jgi:DNA-binding transcriptional ArsR family regulator
MPGSEDPNQPLLKALQHPLRQSLLRHVAEASKSVSPAELAEETQEPLSTISYHVRVLVGVGALEPVAALPSRGSIKHLYRATALVRKAPSVLAMLGLPGPHDKPKNKTSRKKKPKGK